MTEKYLLAGGAAVAGLVIGLAMSGGSKTNVVVTDQINALSAAVEAVAGQVDDLSRTVVANETTIAALTGTMDGQAASLATLGAGSEANASALGELRGALDVLTGDQAGLSQALSGMTGDLGELRGELMAAMRDTLAAAASAGGAASAAAAPAPKADAAAPATVAPKAVTKTANAPKAVAAPQVDEAAQAEALAARAGEDGLMLSVGQTATVGDTQLFLSRLSAEGAHLRVRGADPLVAGVDGRAVALGGCTVALAGIAAGKAYLSTHCADPAADETPADLPEATDLALSVGQTGLFGDMRVFLSRLDEGTAHLRIFTLAGMHENAAVSSRQPHVMGNGCAIALAGLDDRTAQLHAACGDAAAGLGDMATQVAAPAPAAAPAPVAEPAPTLADKLSETGMAVSVGEAAVVGDATLFVQRLPDNTAQLMQMGKGGFVLDVFRAVDLGNGCSVALLGVEGGKAYLEPTCAE
ncbi:MAG: hypothetical protein CML66_30660 [Rhodobacteraceae bacterium]|nr:hypothetical protein [Paracoccaceae bacterium]